MQGHAAAAVRFSHARTSQGEALHCTPVHITLQSKPDSIFWYYQKNLHVNHVAVAKEFFYLVTPMLSLTLTPSLGSFPSTSTITIILLSSHVATLVGLKSRQPSSTYPDFKTKSVTVHQSCVVGTAFYQIIQAISICTVYTPLLLP